ncbi:MAG: flagellar hook-basal body complex protein FliE [Candidatus Sedimenticola sp. (ex Thyasira tokunagai)]
MSVDQIEFIPSAISFEQLLSPETGLGVGENFSAVMEQQMISLNREMGSSDLKLRQLATGENTNLHDVMISLEKVKLSMELMLQVRNKALEAYQELMRTQL